MVNKVLYALIPAVFIVGITVGYAVFAVQDNGLKAGEEPLLNTGKKIVTLAIQPTSSPQDIDAQAKELERFLEERTGYDIVIRIPMTYAGAVEALRFDQADVAFMSAWPSYLASKKAGASLELAEVREVIIGERLAAETYYYSYWVVAKDSPYDSLDDLKGKRAAFPSTLSTSGYVMPLHKLVELGYINVEQGKEADAKQYFSEVFFAGGYAQAWEALKSGKVDVSIIAGDVSEKLYREVLDNTKIIEQQGPIPSHGVVFSKNIDPEVKTKIKNAMLELGKTEEGKQIMRKLISAIFVGFKETNSVEHLGSLEQALETTGLKFTEAVK